MPKQAASDRWTYSAAIALGSNLPSRFGTREQNLLVAVQGLNELGTVGALSSFFDTEPVGLKEQPRFLNAAVLLETQLSPPELMCRLLKLERGMGRQRFGVPEKGPRIIDLDLIWVDQFVISSAELMLPHPAMAERPFVLEPLAEIAPSWIHPVTALSVRDMLQRLGA